MKFWITDEAGVALDATVELEAAAITVFSRGGTAGTPGSQNQDYSLALRLILTRLEKYGRKINGAWVDSGPVQSIPLAERQIYFPADAEADGKAIFSLFGRRMERIGKAPGSDLNKGNRNKRLRIEVSTSSTGELASVIGAKAFPNVPRSALRLPAAELRKVDEIHIWTAIEQLRAGNVRHNFDDSSGYDLVAEDGTTLPPKAVFGLAASASLGFPVQPVNFTGGLATVCFDILSAAGWELVSKADAARSPNQPSNPEDQEWAEGDPRRLAHIRRERHLGVARAKKAQMRAQHGKLFCEECSLDPVATFGSNDGEACIEVHHREIQVAQMGPGHVTKLADVECLCANCHRVRHRQMARQQRTGTA